MGSCLRKFQLVSADAYGTREERMTKSAWEARATRMQLVLVSQ